MCHAGYLVRDEVRLFPTFRFIHPAIGTLGTLRCAGIVYL